MFSGGGMPVVRVENAGKLAQEQKVALIKQLTKVVSEVTKKSISSVYVKIEEVPHENFGVAGEPLG